MASTSRLLLRVCKRGCLLPRPVIEQFVQTRTLHYGLSTSARNCFQQPQPFPHLKQRFCHTEAEISFTEVDFKDVKDRVSKQSGIIVDVRNPDEIAELGQIPGARNVPVHEVLEAFTGMSDDSFKEKYGIHKPAIEEDLVLYCRSGKRAATAYSVLAQAGYKSLFLYKGSWNDWVEKNEQ